MKETPGHDVAVEGLLRDFWERPFPEITTRDAGLLSRPGKADVLIGMRRSGKTYRLFPSATVVTLRESGAERTAHGEVSIVPAWRWLLGL
jgi:hypothetical protein